MTNLSKETPYDSYIEAWKRRRVEEEKELRLKAEETRRRAKEIASFLAKKYRVKKVILFGSVVKGKSMIQSDIDLAVSGLMPEDYFKALVEIEDLAKQEVDLKPLEECQGLFKKRIEEEGEVLYEE